MTDEKEESSGLFKRVLAASAISNVGDGLRLVSLPVAAVGLSAEPQQIALIAAAGQAAWLLAPLLGMVVDRVRPIRLMIVMDCFRLTVSGGLSVLFLLNSAGVPALAIGALMVGLASVLGEAGNQVILPRVVPTRGLAAANSRVYIFQSVGVQLVGPSAGAWMASMSPSVPLALDALSFGVSALLLRGIVRPGDALVGRSTSDQPARAQLMSGFAWVRGHRTMRNLVWIVTWISAASGMANGILVIFSTTVLKLSGAGYGLLLSSAALGVIAGAWVAPAISGKVAGRLRLVAALGVTGVAYFLLPSWHEFAGAGIAVCLAGVGVGVWNVITTAYRQRVVPAALGARISTIYRTAAWGSAAIGAWIGGLLTSWTNSSIVFYVSGVTILCCAVLVTRLPPRAFDATSS